MLFIRASRGQASDHWMQRRERLDGLHQWDAVFDLQDSKFKTNLAMLALSLFSANSIFCGVSIAM